MAAGSIQPHRPRTADGREVVRPELRLPIGMRGFEPVFQYLMDEAAIAETNTTAQLVELRAIRDLLERLNAKTPEIKDP